MFIYDACIKTWGCWLRAYPRVILPLILLLGCGGLPTTPKDFSGRWLSSDGLTKSLEREWRVENQAPDLELPVSETLERLIKTQDRDQDKRITILDEPTKKFFLEGLWYIQGHYPLSVLLQELKLAQDRGAKTLIVHSQNIYENPVDRTHHMISEVFWDGLTRTIDRAGLLELLRDPKSASEKDFYVYVPFGDSKAANYFKNVAKKLSLEIKKPIEVVRLPKLVSPEYVRTRDGKHGILTLALENDKQPGDFKGVPFVVPGGRFNEMYGWDSYFILLGLLADKRFTLARSIVDNFVYEIRQYGRILNANRTYYLTRSQPPFTTSMIREVFDHWPKTTDPLKARQQSSEKIIWARQAFQAALSEYKNVWMSGPRFILGRGLSRYYGEGIGPCPEVEEGHYDEKIRSLTPANVAPKIFIQQLSRMLADYPKLPMPANLKLFFTHDRSMRESGHDTSHRFSDRAADFLTVDLNSLLYKYETDFAWARQQGLLDSPTTAADWVAKAANRRKMMNDLMWDEKENMFFDFDNYNSQKSRFVSATTFYTLWSKLASDEQARLMLKNALPQLEAAGGVASSSKSSRGAVSVHRPQRQWDYPNGWAPHQIITWYGLKAYGYDEDAHRLIHKWLTMIAESVRDFNGTVPEKYDVVLRTHQVFAEYGNVGTKFSYITKEGFGWMNASFQVGLGMLPTEQMQSLRNQVKPKP